jgi:hopanoid biosynthesis associated protein HpnK
MMEERSPRFVIVNADDLGLHESVNKAVIHAHRHGVVTSASIMACGTAFENAVMLVRTCPSLGIGVHLTLVDERSVAPADKVTTLVNKDGFMPRSYMAFARRWLTRQISLVDVVRELEAQVERVLQAGIRPSHFDSHQHVHCLPGIWRAILELAQKYRVPYVRLPYFDSLRADATLAQSAVRAGVNVMAWLRRQASSPTVKHADHVRGFAFSGHMTAPRLLSILNDIDPGLTEIMVHPGLPDEDLRKRYPQCEGFSREQDFEAVTNREVIDLCRVGAFTLASFAGLQRGL